MSARDQCRQQITLKHGRRLGFAEWGNAQGHPILAFIGGSSRLAYPTIALPNIRLITIDRPGLGLKSLPPDDRPIFEANPELCAVFVKDLVETYRQGSRGSAQEGLLAYRPWGFRLEDIRTKVYLWHGENDSSVPLAMARHLAQAIPNCQATYVAKEGHFLGLKYWTEITAQLLAHQP